MIILSKLDTRIKIDIPFDWESTLLAWYDTHKRSLPWRNYPEKSDPYAVWISEIMLQQTTVQTVIPYFERFMQRFPSVVDLAKASVNDVMMMWQGLGYYRRAHHMHRAAQMIADQGFPSSHDAWLQLPGIGPYTAGAITSIALGQPAVVVDGNVARVLSRYFGIDGKNWMNTVWGKARQILPTHIKARPGCYTQALMELGATVCRPRSPECHTCPLKKKCFAFTHQCVPLFPPQKERVIKKKYGIVFIFQRPDGKILLDNDPPVSLLKGLWGFPTTPWTEKSLPTSQGQKIGELKHIFTHFHLYLDIRHCQHISITCQGQKWVSPKDIGNFPMSSLMKKVKKYVDTIDHNQKKTLEHFFKSD
jgi:A/G-specific adenine glycosylase